MIRRPPRSTRTDTRFPYTTLFRSSSIIRLKSARNSGSISVNLTPWQPLHALASYRWNSIDQRITDRYPETAERFIEKDHYDGPSYFGLTYAVDPRWRIYASRLEERRVGQESVRTCRSRGER